MKRLLSISLAFLLLLSNMGLSIASHYCGGHKVLSELVIGSKKLNCGMKAMVCKNNNHAPSIQKKHCCDNELLSLDSKDNFNSNLHQLDVNAPFLIAFVYSYLQFHFPTKEKGHLPVYSPPVLKIDRLVMFHSFLLYS